MIRTYARIFFITGPLFFLGMLFSNLAIMEARPALENALTLGLLFGTAMAAVMGTLHIVRARQAAAGETGRDIYALRQVREFESALDYERLFTTVTHYLEKTAGFTLTEKDQEAGRIAARSPFNFNTFGSGITVRLEKRPGAPTLVRIISKPLVFTVMADYGENLKNARDLEEHLRASGHR